MVGKYFHVDRNDRICLFCFLNETRLLLEDDLRVKINAHYLPRLEGSIYIVGIRETVSYKMFTIYFSLKVYV